MGAWVADISAHIHLSAKYWMSVQIRRLGLPFITFVLVTHFGIHCRGLLSCWLLMLASDMNLQVANSASYLRAQILQRTTLE